MNTHPRKSLPTGEVVRFRSRPSGGMGPTDTSKQPLIRQNGQDAPQSGYVMGPVEVFPIQ